MSPQYGKLWPTSGWDWFGSLGHPSKFQQASCLGFVTAASLFIGGKPNFAQYLAVSWAATICKHFGGVPLMEFCQVQNSLCIQVLHSPIFAGLLHGTRAVAISQTLQHGARNGITQLSQRAPPTGWPKKIGTILLYALTLPTYFTIRIRRKFVIILSLNIPPHLKCITTLPCEMLPFHWSRHWSVASLAWVRCPAAGRNTEHLI